jgi:hypothetical protein
MDKLLPKCQIDGTEMLPDWILASEVQSLRCGKDEKFTFFSHPGCEWKYREGLGTFRFRENNKIEVWDGVLPKLPTKVLTGD